MFRFLLRVCSLGMLGREKRYTDKVGLKQGLTSYVFSPKNFTTLNETAKALKKLAPYCAYDDNSLLIPLMRERIYVGISSKKFLAQFIYAPLKEIKKSLKEKGGTGGIFVVMLPTHFGDKLLNKKQPFKIEVWEEYSKTYLKTLIEEDKSRKKRAESEKKASETIGDLVGKRIEEFDTDDEEAA